MTIRNLYNTDLSLASRITMILAARPHLARTQRMLVAIDFMATNAANFGMYSTNLHGNSIYSASELATRTQQIHQGIRFAVTRGLIDPQTTPTGIRFKINTTGEQFSRQLMNQYASEFRRAVESILPFVDSHSEDEVIKQVERQGLGTPEEGER
ncbi:hypothetical protein HCQ94_01805 [Actinomyces sp. zg-332]|uniref:ABC-three component system middle component 2 n=1 Tax=Actinomyces sp. zg-332 TaxID=2708340 RepID=UPI0014240F8A|nr:ABC-three component system middle component 2 [Actinomyces sp. zg-332]QPK94468.1 hypothetical protein HCQ94_01805 [Actinomyces sp. zg-332]